MKTNKKISDYYLNNEFDLRQLIIDFEPYIKAIINNIVSNNLSFEDKEEILSDVFLIIWKNKDYNIIALDSYLAEITRILIKEKLRKRKVLSSNIDDFEFIAENNIDLLIEQRQLIETVEKNFKNLNDLDLQILTLFYYLDKPIKDIAKELNISSINVKTRLSRIRKKFRDELNKEDNNGF